MGNYSVVDGFEQKHIIDVTRDYISSILSDVVFSIEWVSNNWIEDSRLTNIMEHVCFLVVLPIHLLISLKGIKNEVLIYSLYINF